MRQELAAQSIGFTEPKTGCFWANYLANILVFFEQSRSPFFREEEKCRHGLLWLRWILLFPEQIHTRVRNLYEAHVIFLSTTIPMNQRRTKKKSLPHFLALDLRFLRM